MGSNSNLIVPILKDKAQKNLLAMKKTCQAEIEQRVKLLRTELVEAESSLLQQLDEELGKGSREMSREVCFLPAMLPQDSLSNILGFVASDGVLPSHLSLSFLSELKDLRPGATLSLEVETEAEVRDVWQQKIVVTVQTTEEDGSQRNLSVQHEAASGKFCFRFKAEEGVHKICVTLYGQHVNFSPLLLPVGRLSQELNRLGLCFMDESGETELTQKESEEEDCRAASDSSKRTGLTGQEFCPGQTVLVNRAGGWSKAVVRKPLSEHPKVYLVQFTEAGTFDGVRSEEMIITEDDHNLVEKDPEVPRIEEGQNDDGVEEAGMWKVNDGCVAKWEEDQVWYNAQILQCLSNKKYHVKFTDFGNEVFVNEAGMVKSSLDIPDNERINELVRQDEEVSAEQQAVCSEFGSSEDSSDFDEEDSVPDITESVDDIEPVDKSATATVSGDLSFSVASLLQNDARGGQSLPVTKNLLMKNFKAPVKTLQLLQDGSFICLIGQNVVRFSREGEQMFELKRNKDFVPPRNLLVRQNGEVVIIDEEGFKVYNRDLQLLRDIKTNIPVGECHGLAEDQEGHVITVNVNKSGRGVTEKGSSSIFIIDVESWQLVNIITLEQDDQIDQAKSSCEFIAFRNGVFYVVDLGLERVYVVPGYGETGEMFGDTGRGQLQFREPNSLVVDCAGNIIVAAGYRLTDTAGYGYRLQVVSKDLEFLGLVKGDSALSRPSLLCLDEMRGELYVFSKWARSVIRFKM